MYAFIFRSIFPVISGSVIALTLCIGDLLSAQEDPPGEPTPESVPASPAMTAARMAELLRIIDPDAQRDGNTVRFVIGERAHVLVFDEDADRMRLMAPIASVEALSEGLMYRMLQANYDSALDVRYATAQGLIWSVFVHPLSSLAEEFLVSAIRQVHIAAETFGTTFSSGEMIYGGGDSQEQLEELEEALDRLLNPTT